MGKNLLKDLHIQGKKMLLTFILSGILVCYELTETIVTRSFLVTLLSFDSADRVGSS